MSSTSPRRATGAPGLDWAEVAPRIRHAFVGLPDVEVHLYPPDGAPTAEDMVVHSPRPEMKPGRAALIEVLHRYADQALDAPSLIETQKLMYFLQLAGQPPNLEFEPKHYGPYAGALRHVLKAAHEVLDDDLDAQARIDRVMTLAEGFETAYGMELLATVHWVANQADASASDMLIAHRVSTWSPRQAGMVTPDHVDVALETLRNGGWLAPV